MKRQFKLLACLLVVIAMVFTLASCDLVNKILGKTPDTEHEHSFVNGKCDCGEEDPNYVPPHEHNFVDGKCECGEDDPNYVAPAPTSGTIDVTTTDTYCYDDMYTFTAVGEGKYTFTLPEGLGFCSATATQPEVDSLSPDYVAGVNTAVVELEAGATLEFYIAATEKADWQITWTYEACEVEAGGGETPEGCTHDYCYPAMGHEDMVLPTCQNGGVIVTICFQCEEVFYEEVGPDTVDGHDYVIDMETYKEATCLENGFKKETCSLCGDVQETVLSKEYASHDYVVDDETYKEANCQEAGYGKYTCSVCGDSYEENPEADPIWGHKDEYSAFYSIMTCTVCNRVQFGVYIDPTETTFGIQFAQNYGTGALFFAAFNSDSSIYEAYDYTVAYADGIYTVTLVNTNEYETSEYGLLTATITIKAVCAGLEVTITPAEGEAIIFKNYEEEHIYGEGVVTDPTCGAAGYTTYTCEYCDAFYKEEGDPATGEHDYVDGICSVCEMPNALTIPEANELAATKEHNTYTTDKYVVVGTIASISNTTYGNMVIVDDDKNELTIYGTWNADGSLKYGEMEGAPAAGDVITVCGVLGTFNGTNQMKNGWIMEVIPHTEHVYADATCLNPKTCICGATDGEPLGHSYVDGECSRCGAEDPAVSGVVITKDDFGTLTTNTSYASGKSTNGWSFSNAAILANGTVTCMGASDKAVTLNGKTSTVGSLVSPTVAGVSKISFNYTNSYSESNGVDLAITVKDADGNVLASTQLDNNSVTKNTAYTFEWTLDEAVTGNCTITITNNSPTNSTSNKDRVSIWNVQITSPVN